MALRSSQVPISSALPLSLFILNFFLFFLPTLRLSGEEVDALVYHVSVYLYMERHPSVIPRFQLVH